MASTPVAIYTLPTAVLGVGTHGPFVSPAVGAAYAAYQISVTPRASWPQTGPDPIVATVEYSVDGGVTWRFDAQRSYKAGPWLDRAGNPLTSDLWTVTMGVLNPGPNQTVLATALADLFRVTLDVAQVCSPLILMSGLA